MSNKKSVQETKEMLAARMMAKPGAAAAARASAARAGAQIAPPKPTRPPTAAFVARAMKAEWPLKEAEGND